MATTTDYDAPRRPTVEDAEDESLNTFTTARTGAHPPVIDLDDEADVVVAVELPFTDSSNVELTMPVIPARADEFTCHSCFLVQHRSRMTPAPDLHRLRLMEAFPSLRYKIIGAFGRCC